MCSGIEAASVAWSPLSWMPVAFSEIDQFPSAVLAHRYPDVPNWGDMTQFEEWPDADIDVLVGGTPCQSFSVAGLRKGLADPRGNLTLTYLAIAERYRPRWLVWENVPGVLSSGGGRDFGAFLGGLVELGYGWAYRVLDAQFFGVAQRRRRVFVVASARGWAAAAAVLFEPSGLRGNPAPRREAGEGASQRAERSLAIRGRDGIASADEGQTPIVEPIAFDETQVTHAENRSRCAPGDPSPTLARGARPPAVALNARQDPDCWDDRCGPLDALLAHAIRFSSKDYGGDAETDLSPTLRAGGHDASPANSGISPAACIGPTVRRLTPRECERLQGFPDDWTLVPYRGKPAKDGPRYKAISNSMAVPVVRWIGERVQEVETLEIARGQVR